MTITKDDIVKSLKLNNIDVLNVVSNNNTETQNEYTQICREVNFYADPSIKNITSTNSTSTSISPISTITSIISTTEPKTTTPNCICNTPTTSTCPPPITVTCPTTLSTMPATTCTPCPSCTSVATNTQTTSIPTNASSTVGSSSTPNTNTVTTVTNGGSSLSSITATVGQSTSIPITVTSNTPSTSGSTLSTASQITTASVSEGSSLSSITATTSQSTPIPITVTSNTPGTSGSTLSTASQITTASVSEGSSLSSTTATVGQSTSIPSNVTSTAPSTSGSSLSTANTSQATITTSVPSITSTITTGSSSIASSISGATNTITTTLGQTLSTMTSSTSNTTTTCPPCLTSTTPTSPNPWTKDVLILIDSSNDFDDYGYKQLMEFLAYKMLPLWPVNDTLVNVAIGTFNVEILNVISFFDDNNISNLQNKILKDTYPHMIQYNPSLTSAFRKTARMHSSRHAPWVTLLVTATSNSTDIASAAQFINPESTVIVVGIGNAGNGDFSKFNSTGANLNVFLTTDNYPTDAVATSIAQIISPGYSASVTPPITTTIVPPICEPDVAILIDNSMATLTKENYLWEIDFIANMLVNSWIISPVNIEALAMIYNLQSTSLGNGSITFKYNSTDQLREIIQDFDDDDRLDFPPSINAGISHLQSFLNSRRSGKELVILLFTYSRSITRKSYFNKLYFYLWRCRSTNKCSIMLASSNTFNIYSYYTHVYRDNK
uniref:VWFA domain-containing protein n=1 Tax=Acrobeloides nanus TaxID=290746 RepID=A0A914CIF2_9BILA